MKNEGAGEERSVTRVIRPSEWRGQRDHFIIECHYPRFELEPRTPRLTRAAIIFSRVSTVHYIGPLIYVVLHLTVTPSLCLNCHPSRARKRASAETLRSRA